jgi:hypothetical protein
MSNATRELAITNETGEGPEAQFLRNTIKASVFLTSEGQTPLGALAAFSSSYGMNPGAAARFAGQEGETPLSFAVRFG